MTGVFVDLTLWSVRNRLRARLRRLREPRYLVGGIAGVAWFGFFVLRPLFQAPPSGRHIATPMASLMTHVDAARFVAALVLLAMALLIALLPGKRHPLQFSPAEVQFLFPAPIPRRQLVRYKLVRSQGGLLLGAAIATVLLRPATLRSGWMFSVGFWLVLTVGRVYSVAVGLSRGGGAAPGGRGVRGGWTLVAASIAVVVVLGVAAAADWSRLTAEISVGARIDELRRVWSAGAPRIVLWPFVTLASLPFAGSAAAFGAALPGTLLLLALTYGAVMRADAAFEEGAAAETEKRASAPARAPRVVARARAAPFPLALHGRPETAILWKNLILLGRYASLSTLLRVLPVLLVFPMFMLTGKKGGGSVATAVVLLSATFGAMLILVGSGVARNDLRQDLGRLAVLKSWPVSGAAIVRGELLAPAIVLSVATWLCILVAAFAVEGMAMRAPLKAMLLSHRTAYAAAAMLAAPAVILAQLVVQNGLAVLFPAWMHVGPSRNRGVEATGQGMLLLWGALFASLVFLVPPAIGAGLVAVTLAVLTHSTVVVAPAAVLLALVIGQSLLATSWLGRALERSDLSAVDPVE